MPAGGIGCSRLVTCWLDTGYAVGVSWFPMRQIPRRRLVSQLTRSTIAVVMAGGRGQRLMQLAVQTLGMPEGQEVAQKLASGMPLEDAALGIGVSITATSGSANKEVERQGFTTLLQLAAALYPQFIQAVTLAMQTPGTPVADVALHSAQGLAERKLSGPPSTRHPSICSVWITPPSRARFSMSVLETQRLAR